LVLIIGIRLFSGTSALELTIEEAISRGIDRSYSLESAVQDSLAAHFEYLAAKAAFWPALSFNATAFYSDPIQKIATPWQEIRLGQNENYLAELKLSFPLYVGGRLLNQLKLRRTLLEMSGFGLEAERMRAARAIRMLSLQYLIAEASLVAAEASLARLDLLGRDTHSRFAAGLADSLDLLESQLSISIARRLVIEKKSAVAATRLALSVYLNLPAAEEIVLVDSIPRPKNPAENPELYPAGVENRPELKAASSRIAISKHTEKMIRGNLLPGIAAFAAYSYGWPNRDLTGDHWNDSFMSGLNLYWEFNLGGGELRNVQAAASKMRSSLMAKDGLAESFSIAAEIARLELQKSYDQFLLASGEFSMAENKYRLALERQNAGLLSLNQVLESEKELAASEQKYRQAILDFYLKETEYFYSVGSGKIYGGLN